MKNSKKAIFISTAILIISAILFCLFPRTAAWNGTVRFYNLNGADLSLPDDASLDEMTDCLEIQCDFSISGPLFPKSMIGGSGTVNIDGIEYSLSSSNIEIERNWIPMSLSGNESEISKQLYVSPNKKYILLNYPLERSEEEGGNAVYWIGCCKNAGELKEALKDFGLPTA